MIFNINYKWSFVACWMGFLLLVMNAANLHAQCNQWEIAAEAQTSTCAANGKVTVSLTGSGASSLSNVLYSLASVSSGGYNVPQGEARVFENVPGDTYRVIVQAVCNGVSITKEVNVIVPTTYEPLNVAVLEERQAFVTCNTGQARLTFAGGKAPYTINITGKPAAYTGRLTFTTSASSLLVDSLLGGNYVFSITDACAATPSTQNISIGTITSINQYEVGLWLVPIPGECNKVTIQHYSGGRLGPYFADNGPLQMNYSLDGTASTEYKSFRDIADTLTLPAGKTIKDYYGGPVHVNLKSYCGNVLTYDVVAYNPYASLTYEANCKVDFNLAYTLEFAEMLCYPVYFSVKNNATNEERYDTVTFAYSGTIKRFINNLPFGNYTASLHTSDGKSLYYGDMNVAMPGNESPYTISVYDGYGVYGNAGYVMLALSKTSLFSVGTKIDMISPTNQFYSYTINDNTTNFGYLGLPEGGLKFFEVGNYRFRVTDNCGVYEIPVVVEEKDVYRYSWNYVKEQTCAGLMITPFGEAWYNGDTTTATYYQILAGPAGYDNKIVPAGGGLLLSIPGNYKIGVSAYSGLVMDFNSTKEVSYLGLPLAIDVNKSLGWVCPRQPNNSGVIRAFAANGSKAATGAFTFRLAEAGKGSTGPYLATVTGDSAQFSTATSGGAYTLIANQSYDVRVEDECGASAVQTLKIIDFATAQVVSAERPEYCLGETVRFNVINLPTTAKQFRWTGPNGFTFTGEHLVIPRFKASDTGTYRVAISCDMCTDSIIGTAHIAMIPYLPICYSAVTDTSVNPYVYGLLGNWHPARSYTYYSARAESDPNQETNIRENGAFGDFDNFWELKNGKWSANKVEKWVWNAESTIFSAKGFELENRDPLGRYNSGIYGYGEAIPVAVVQNSRYQEAAFEGFEDYYFDNSNCEVGCPSARRFNFAGYKSKIDSTQRHTGRYSIRVRPGDTVGIVSTVMAAADTLGLPSFNEATINCNGIISTVLKSVRANSELLLPSFAPLSGKKVLFSAWVKEMQDCSCTSYENNQITLAVTDAAGNSVPVRAKPAGAIIDGWQRYEQVIDVPAGSKSFAVVLQATGSTTVFYDDIRIHPYNANMKSFIYDARNLRMMAELDENNYATFFEYDDDATLTRIKKETERGVKTIKETRSALIKE